MVGAVEIDRASWQNSSEEGASAFLKLTVASSIKAACAQRHSIASGIWLRFCSLSAYFAGLFQLAVAAFI